MLQWIHDTVWLECVLVLVGLFYLLRLAVSWVWSLQSTVRAFYLSNWIAGYSYGARHRWAAITGASDGIGKGYALELASYGVNVILLSRSEDKLQNVAKEITELYGVEVRIVVVDFSKTDIYESIRRQIGDLEVGILINNVGVTHEFPDYFLNVSDDRLWQLINVNMAATVMMTRMLLPGMLARRSGVVVNISSMCSVCPLPLLSVYSASKIFVDYFTAGLQKEYSGRGVIIQDAMPCYVATKMAGIRKTSFFVPGPRRYARDALATVGIQAATYGTLSHTIQMASILRLPVWSVQWLSFRALNATRRRSLLKRTNKPPQSSASTQ